MTEIVAIAAGVLMWAVLVIGGLLVRSDLHRLANNTHDERDEYEHHTRRDRAGGGGGTDGTDGTDDDRP